MAQIRPNGTITLQVEEQQLTENDGKVTTELEIHRKWETVFGSTFIFCFLFFQTEKHIFIFKICR